MRGRGRGAQGLAGAGQGGAGGRGDGAAAAALDPKPSNLGTAKLKGGDKPAQIFATLGKGVAGTAMIAFTHLPDEERWALAYHVATLRDAAKGKKK